MNSQKKLIGKWERTSEEVWYTPFDTLEFFSDGTYASDDANYDGTFSVDNKRIKLNGVLVSPLTCTFEIKGNTLTLVCDNHGSQTYTWIFEKIND